jgi:predicted nuclease with RNAse H fold
MGKGERKKGGLADLLPNDLGTVPQRRGAMSIIRPEKARMISFDAPLSFHNEPSNSGFTSYISTHGPRIDQKSVFMRKS